MKISSLLIFAYFFAILIVVLYAHDVAKTRTRCMEIHQTWHGGLDTGLSIPIIGIHINYHPTVKPWPIC